MIRTLAAFVGKILCGLAGWLVVAPLAAAIPKRRDWLAVIGRDDGLFLDNAKYFFLQGAALMPAVRVAFITGRADVVELLANTPYEGIRYPDLRAIWFLARAGATVVDSSEWYRGGRRFLLVRSRIVQLWHGVGFKFVELALWRKELGDRRAASTLFALRKLAYHISGRLVRYDIVNTTSAFYRDNVFGTAFLSKIVTVCGYPRNTFAILSGEARRVALRNVDRAIADKIEHWLAERKRIVLVTPTFRTAQVASMGLDDKTTKMLDEFAENHGIEFVFKFHPVDRTTDFRDTRHLHRCEPISDLYPLIPASHAMISDYSSIYMDYLLLDKPVLFLVPDLEEYIRTERKLQFDFDAMAPGPKVSTWEQMTQALLAQWQNDDYAVRRRELCNKAFDALPQSEATLKLISAMRERGILREPKKPGGARAAG